MPDPQVKLAGGGTLATMTFAHTFGYGAPR